MRRYIVNLISPKIMLVIAVVLVAVFIVIAAQVDWQVSGFAKSPSVYADLFNLEMFFVGFALALALGLVYRNIVLFIGIVGSTLILLASNFEDCMYFLFNGGFPLNNVNWTWMKQVNFAWFWDTSSQIEWTIIWMLILGIFVYSMTRLLKK